MRSSSTLQCGGETTSSQGPRITRHCTGLHAEIRNQQLSPETFGNGYLVVILVSIPVAGVTSGQPKAKGGVCTSVVYTVC